LTKKGEDDASPEAFPVSATTGMQHNENIAERYAAKSKPRRTEGPNLSMIDSPKHSTVANTEKVIDPTNNSVLNA
tara:strand:- start:175 stop:399 length:225 start_codon:yes stop_codon:yes gene_type:complete